MKRLATVPSQERKQIDKNTKEFPMPPVAAQQRDENNPTNRTKLLNPSIYKGVNMQSTCQNGSLRRSKNITIKFFLLVVVVMLGGTNLFSTQTMYADIPAQEGAAGRDIATGCPVIARAGGITRPEWGNANDAVDYNTTTNPGGGRWGNETNAGSGTFETVDLGAEYLLTGIGYKLNWDGRFENSLTMEVAVSTDNTTWTTVSNVAHPLSIPNGSADSWIDVNISFAPLTARYVRYMLPPDGSWNGWGSYFHLRAFSQTTSTTCSSAASGNGRDMVEIPAGAVVGTFTDWTPLYYMSHPDAPSNFQMQPGQSLWVVGIDESGAFYKVLLSGDWYWVPAANIGPTYDDVWHGTPLPTTVVE